MELGERLAAWLAFRGMSQRDLADAIDMQPSTVCMWIGRRKSKTGISQSSLEKVVDALGLTMEQFYGSVPKRKRRATA